MRHKLQGRSSRWGFLDISQKYTENRTNRLYCAEFRLGSDQRCGWVTAAYVDGHLHSEQFGRRELKGRFHSLLFGGGATLSDRLGTHPRHAWEVLGSTQYNSRDF